MAHSKLVTSDELSLNIITNNLIINIGNVFRNTMAVAQKHNLALDQHKGYKGPQLTGTTRLF